MEFQNENKQCQIFKLKLRKMKTSMKNVVLSGFIIASLLVASSCQKDNMNAENAQYASVLTVASDGTTAVIEANLKSALIETSALTQSELASLLKMKEEEKLARDVYTALGVKWGSVVFTNISAAEITPVKLTPDDVAPTGRFSVKGEINLGSRRSNVHARESPSPRASSKAVLWTSISLSSCPKFVCKS